VYKVDINIKTFFIALLFIFGVYIAYELRTILLMLFVAFIIFSALKPIIDRLERKGIKRFLAIAFVYLFAILFFGILLIIIGVVMSQLWGVLLDLSKINISDVINENFPFLSKFIDVNGLTSELEKLVLTINPKNLGSVENISLIIQNLSPLAISGISLVSKFVGGVATVIMTIIISVYMVSSRKDFYENGLLLLPNKYRKKSNQLLDQIREKLGAWTIGELILMFVIGFATYVAIMIPSLFVENYRLADFALAIAIIAGFLEAIPNIGPLITLVVAVLFALLLGSGIGVIIYIIIAFIVIQQMENILLVPTVMRRSIDLNPLLSIIAVLAGFQVAGPIGALLSVPIAVVIQIIVVDIMNYWKNHSDNS
jgi:predicted PurR-regulated permease PerM